MTVGLVGPFNNRTSFKAILADGRVTFTLFGSPGQEEVNVKYQLLNPSPNFKDVVDEARAVILAGGTMSPVQVVKSSEKP